MESQSAEPACVLITSLSGPRAAETVAYIGCYSQSGKDGIYVCHFDTEKGVLEAPHLAVDSVNASFLAIHPTQAILYAVGETSRHGTQHSGSLAAFSVQARTGALDLLNRVASRGADPCHAAVDRAGRRLAAANYSGGSVSVFHLRDDGAIGECTAFTQLSGSGPHARQGSPHPHQVAFSPDGRFLYVPDLGTDSIHCFALQSGRMEMSLVHSTPMPAASGPRHLSIHANARLLLVNTELSNAVTSFSIDRDTGSLAAVQTVSSLPAGFSQPSHGAELAMHPNGRYLYATNRGHDSIVQIVLDPETGHMTGARHTPCGGKHPRHCAFDSAGRFLLVANQESGSIAVFRVDAETGHPALQQTRRITPP